MVTSLIHAFSRDPQQSGHFTCSRERTDHVLPTPARRVLAPGATVKPAGKCRPARRKAGSTPVRTASWCQDEAALEITVVPRSHSEVHRRTQAAQGPSNICLEATCSARFRQLHAPRI